MRIVRTRRYQKDLRRLGVSGPEAAAVELAIAANPSSGDVIPGLGGIRKLRFGFGGRGKRGGGRAISFLLVDDDTAIMIFAYQRAAKGGARHSEGVHKWLRSPASAKV